MGIYESFLSCLKGTFPAKCANRSSQGIPKPPKWRKITRVFMIHLRDVNDGFWQVLEFLSPLFHSIVLLKVTRDTLSFKTSIFQFRSEVKSNESFLGRERHLYRVSEEWKACSLSNSLVLLNYIFQMCFSGIESVFSITIKYSS